MTSAWCCGFYYSGDKEHIIVEKETIGIQTETRLPLETIEGATHGKMYLRDDSCPFNVSSFLDLYTQNLRRLHSYSGKETKITISLRSSSSYLPSLIYMVLILASSTPELGSISSS